MRLGHEELESHWSCCSLLACSGSAQDPTSVLKTIKCINSTVSSLYKVQGVYKNAFLTVKHFQKVDLIKHGGSCA